MKRLSLTSELRYKRQINSEGKAEAEMKRIPDEKNREICLSCPYLDCIGCKCTLINKRNATR